MFSIFGYNYVGGVCSVVGNFILCSFDVDSGEVLFYVFVQVIEVEVDVVVCVVECVYLYYW